MNAHFDHLHMTAGPLTSLESWKSNMFLEWDSYTADFAYAVERILTRKYRGVRIWSIGRKSFRPNDFYVSVSLVSDPVIQASVFTIVSHDLTNRQRGIEWMAQHTVSKLVTEINKKHREWGSE